MLKSERVGVFKSSTSTLNSDSDIEEEVNNLNESSL